MSHLNFVLKENCRGKLGFENINKNRKKIKKFKKIKKN